MKKLLSFMLIALSFYAATGQNDTIQLKNGDKLHGEIKRLRSGILTIETPYSDSDFTVDFSEVTVISIQKMCFVVLAGGRRLTGYIRTETPNEFIFTDEDGQTETIPIQDLVVLNELDAKFWKRISGNIDLSYNLTKANNASQFTVGGGIYYRGPAWNGAFSINSLNSNQDNVDEIERTDISLDVQRVLPGNWYLLASYDFLSNTEQALDARHSIRGGAGRFLILSNKLSWGLNAGLNYNIERFTDLTPNNESTEIYLGTEFFMFDYKDWSLKSNLNAFPSLTESGRWRVDYNLDIIWDLPLDFYIKTNLQFNYDSRAAVSGSEFDYIWTTGFGWSFN